MTDDTHSELFQRGLTVAQFAAADRPEVGVERQLFLSGLITGLAFDLAETMTDDELRAGLAIVAELARERRKHNNARAN